MHKSCCSKLIWKSDASQVIKRWEIYNNKQHVPVGSAHNQSLGELVVVIRVFIALQDKKDGEREVNFVTFFITVICGQFHKIRLPGNPHKSGFGIPDSQSYVIGQNLRQAASSWLRGSHILSEIWGKSVIGKSYFLRIRFPTKRLWESGIPKPDLWGFPGSRILWNWPLI